MQIRDNKDRAKWVLIIFYWTAFITIVAVISGIMEYNLLSRGMYTEEEGDSNDIRQMIVGALQFITSILGGVFFIMWFRRSYFNLHALGIRMQYKEGWAAGSWFVPILNFFRPYQIMDEIWEQIQIKINTPIQEPKTILGFWWGGWVIGGIIDRIATRMVFRAETMEDFMNSTMLTSIGECISLVTLGLIILIVRKVSKWEDELYKQSFEMPIEDHLI